MFETVVLTTCVLAAAASRPSTMIPAVAQRSMANYDRPTGYLPESVARLPRATLAAKVTTMTQPPEVQWAQSPFDRVAAELDTYLRLAPGWDGEGSRAPTQEAVDKAKAFLRTLPFGVPPPKPMVSANGAAELYWDLASGYLDVSFTSEGDVSLYGETPGGVGLYRDGLEPNFRRFPDGRTLLEIVAPEQARLAA